jgi:hypothetical protein
MQPLGTLKTEEKIERQCGQRSTTSVVETLSVNSSIDQPSMDKT